VNQETKSDQKITQSIAFISQHLHEPVKVTHLAGRANLSCSYFWALFKQRTGYAPVDFLIRLRMNQAGYLLNSTNLKVKKIAAALGYRDPLYFSRLFKSVHGVAPTSYRTTGSNNAPLLPPISLAGLPEGVASGHLIKDHKRNAK
jgi:transcriptional regulator GlxA family with amidase domain